MARRQILTSTKYPYLHIRIKFGRDHSESLAILDSGFTGHVAIPKDVFNGDLGLPDFREVWQMADGSTVSTPVYHGMVEIVGFVTVPALITVLGHEYMLGRGVIDRFKVTFDHGKKIIVEA